MLMRDQQLVAVIVTDADERPLGIVTERDLVYKIVTTGDIGTPAAEIMTSPLITTTPDVHLYEALYLMMRHRVRRLVVVDGAGRLLGFVSMKDLIRVEGYEGEVLTSRIGSAQSTTELCRTRTEIDGFIHKLFLGDVDAQSLTEILTDYNDALTRRVIRLAQQELRPDLRRPAQSFAWVCFGSEGRREQVLRGDQDNGMIVADDADAEALSYYRRLAQEVNEDLDTCGFELCQGGVMAREDRWFGTLTEWKNRVYRLIHGLEDGELLRDLTIFLDLRRIEGESAHVDALWDFTIDEMGRAPFAVRALAEDAVAKPVPLNFLGRFQYDKGPDGRKGINVKRYGLLPLMASIKVLAIEYGIRETQTTERIRALQEKNALEKESAENLLFANELFLRLKIQDSLEQVLHGKDGEYFVYPDEWSEWERQNLKRAFKAVGHLADILRFHFHL